ncbi:MULTISPECIES: PP2C family protein-serine/threonine phosphatase [Nostocales]|uniref:Regulator n=3 Tax=Nostocales TaxID=1161 RepID=A0A0C1N2D4_9CYAN|nr:SpoIIE family protein phosphatase [Tolypothrix bouteillei]KAF3890138.1 SpoIIE family protein phosphatase [Tolypothrix bouteillei VB521301]
MFKILIIDDDPIVRMVLKKALYNQGYDVTVASSGKEGIVLAQQELPALIICDWIMSGLDGLEVCRQIKANPELTTTFFILLTAKGASPGEESDRVQGLDAGADEFVSKPIEMNELKARVRAGLRIHQLYQDLHNQKKALEILNQNLHTQKQILETELAQAADYVRSLLPSPLVGKVSIESLFLPSVQLGGDCFDYYWIDDENLAIYLLDVSGHGVGSALLSVSVLNVIRSSIYTPTLKSVTLCSESAFHLSTSQSLPKTNLFQPSQVLSTLNQAFQMSNHSEKYFTIWYGVYNRSQRQLVYANAGHPPAILLSGTDIQVRKLDAFGFPIGFLSDADYEDITIEIPKNSTLYLFSDGAYEILQANEKIWGLNAFIDVLMNCTQTNTHHLKQILAEIMSVNTKSTLDDDLSLLKVNF